MLQELTAAVERFSTMDGQRYERGDLGAYHRILANVHGICGLIVALERSGATRKDLLPTLEPARAIYGKSPFGSRLQKWPRGYAGDFETVEYICDCANRVEEPSLAHYLEEMSLRCPIAAQHRGKIRHQADLVHQTIQTKAAPAILSVGCGGCRDLMLITHELGARPCKLVLNDLESDAIQLAEARLSRTSAQRHYVVNTVLRPEALDQISRHGPYDLVVLGGVLDYFSDKLTVFLIKRLYSLLKPDGRLFFTNIHAGNVYRPWMEYLADWFLIERSMEDIARLTTACGIAPERVSASLDLTGLTLLVQLSAPGGTMAT